MRPVLSFYVYIFVVGRTKTYSNHEWEGKRKKISLPVKCFFFFFFQGRVAFKINIENAFNVRYIHPNVQIVQKKVLTYTCSFKMCIFSLRKTFFLFVKMLPFFFFSMRIRRLAALYWNNFSKSQLLFRKLELVLIW